MNVRDLDEHEQLVLMGLVKLIVHADQVVSPEEREVLGRLQVALGPETWNDRVRQASDAFPSVSELEQAAHEVVRPEAQALIQDVLAELAGSDELIEEEAHVLDWMHQAWSDDVDGDDDHDHDDDVMEAFVLMDED